MHPIERLRWIARAQDEAPALLASEAAWTLADLAREEPQALVTACRRLIDSQATAAPLWWVSANVLVDPDPEAAARRVVDELCGDPTADRLAEALARTFGDGVTFVVPAPLELIGESLSRCLAVSVRVVGLSPRLRGQVRAIGSLVDDASGWELDEIAEALDCASAVVVHVVAASADGILVWRDAASLV